MKTEQRLLQRLREKREEILRLCARYGATDVRVFGSVARGEADVASDVDLIVRFEPGRAFLQNELIQVWIIHHLQLIGEAAARLGQAFHAAYPQIPWAQIVAMRNILVHEYFGIDLEEVWTTVERDLPLLKAQITAILRELEAP